jgi:hypothetical protein
MKNPNQKLALRSVEWGVIGGGTVSKPTPYETAEVAILMALDPRS